MTMGTAEQMQPQAQSTLDVIYENWRGYHEKLRDVMEHDLHHGGEVSLILGMNGLRTLDL